MGKGRLIVHLNLTSKLSLCSIYTSVIFLCSSTPLADHFTWFTDRLTLYCCSFSVAWLNTSTDNQLQYHDTGRYHPRFYHFHQSRYLFLCARMNWMSTARVWQNYLHHATGVNEQLETRRLGVHFSSPLLQSLCSNINVIIAAISTSCTCTSGLL